MAGELRLASRKLWGRDSLIDKAREKGISVPFTEYSYHAIKALEEKNDGKFEY